MNETTGETMNSMEIIPTNEQVGGTFLAPAITVDEAVAIYNQKNQFVQRILKENFDFGKIPGSSKPSLLKPGAEKLCSFFGLRPSFEITNSIEDWMGTEHGGEPLFSYSVKCHLYRNGQPVGSADASCNSWEVKYRYRQAQRICPTCGATAIIKGKEEYGGGWLCFPKKGGCGAKFIDADPSITNQKWGMEKNPDVADLVNTILKMAEKRALVAAVLVTTGASEWFTQDIEEFQNNASPEKEAFVEKLQQITLEQAKQFKTDKGKSFSEMTADQLEFIIQKTKSAQKKKAAEILLDDMLSRPLEAPDVDTDFDQTFGKQA